MNLSKLYRLMSEAQELDKKYYYVVLGGNYVIDGHYWNDDIKAYTPEGDEYKEKDGWTSDKFATWDDLLNDLDSELLLTPDDGNSIEDIEDPDTLPVTEKDGRKVIFEYTAVKHEIDDEEEYNYYEEYDVYYDIQVCVV